MSKELDQIEEMLLTSPLKNEPGSLIYSSLETLRKGNLIFLGLNPGGLPDENKTILEHFQFMKRIENKEFNEYCDGVWKPAGVEKPRGGSVLQKRVQYLLSSLAINTRNVFASNLIFKRTRAESDLNNESYWAEICWKIHQKFISIIDPSLIVVMGNSPYEFINGKMKKILRTEIFNSGHGDWNCEFSEGFLNGKKRKLIKIPHLSRYKINAHNDVINWIKSVGDIKR